MGEKEKSVKIAGQSSGSGLGKRKSFGGSSARRFGRGKANVVADALSQKTIANLTVSPLSLVHDLRALYAKLVKDANGRIYGYSGRMCVPNVVELKNIILQKAHDSPFVMHPGGTKIYQSSIRMPPYEALYGRKYKTLLCWDQVSERKLIGSEIVWQTEEKIKIIQDRLKAASDRQKSYVDLKRWDIEYNVGDKVFLKVSQWKKVMRFGRKEKLSHRFIGPYEILERVGPLAYRLALPPELDRIHNVFHVSMLRRYRSDPSHVLPLESIEVSSDLTYDKEPVAILARETKQLRNKQIPPVKVLWRNHSRKEATWEREEDMRRQHPQLF
ncbi:uncharacterized protein LOC131170230 [Hevea brasiliensis]|uniref:uncharacterized protein LOC131170230 n=1 Tax=Hevea brasiliensis TaxID=3981 RepID=UPI0025FB266F|nr:uncharacterized protein LOC131170230 [Hevea brasiliensis]